MLDVRTNFQASLATSNFVLRSFKDPNHPYDP